MCHPLPLACSSRSWLWNPQDQFGKSKSHEKTIDTAKEKLEEFLKGPWPALQKLVKSLD